MVPVIEVNHLPPEKLRLLAVTLNRIAETGKWDEHALAQELEELLDLGEDVLVTGFEMAEVDTLIFDETASEDEGIEDLPCLPVNSVSRPGDLWTLGDHRLVQGDALDPANYALLTHDGPGARMILTDVPFNVPNVGHTTGKAHHREFAMAHGEMSSEEFAAFNQKWMGNAASVLMDGGLLASFIDWRSVEIILAAGRAT